MAYIMQGDEYGLGVKLSLTDGTVVTPDIVQDVEITTVARLHWHRRFWLGTAC